ncbi:MAG: hypothetical protein HFH31_04475 [Bacilli bacterium]|nr:hypothetical protein [Bacilli bacterium]
MVLRKPYAFLVKHFKMIHALMTLVIAYLVYRTNFILNFLNEYMSATEIIKVDNITNTIFNIWMFIFPFLLIVFSLIIISLMRFKKKPILFYILNIALAIAILIFYNYSYSLLTQMETVLLETRTVRLVRDFITMLELMQCVSMIAVLIRATGFNIKKFDFGKDLAELEIEEKDNEEFEINLEVDTNKVYRKINRFKRIVKYTYYEHRFFIDVGILLAIALICFVVYMNIGIYDRDVKENTIFATTSFHLGVTKSYITNKDYKGNVIDEENMLVVLEINARSKGSAKEFETAMVSLQIGDKKFYHIERYRDSLMDLGSVYQGAEIGTSFEKHILVFKIPKSLANKKMIFTYTDKVDYISKGINSKYIRVQIKPIKIDENKIKYNDTIENELSFKESVFDSAKISIDTVSIAKEFRETYQFCPVNDECYLSAEFIHPNYNSNEEKAILKIKGKLELDEGVTLNQIYSLYHFIYYYATLKYEKNGSIITQKVTMNQVKPSKFNYDDIYYIEVSADTIDADKVWLDFHIRNKEYMYQIK